MNASQRFVGRARRVILGLIPVAIAGLVVLVWQAQRRPETPRAETTAPVPVPPATRGIELFFADARGQDLVLESREVVGDQSREPALIRAVVEELLRGPEDLRGRAVFPEGVGLAHVFVDPSGLVTLDFTPTLRARFRGGSTGEVLLVQSLLRTLATNVPNVSRVTLTVGGEPIETLGGHVRLTGPLVVSEWR